jgi:hypothetical protein
MPPTERLYRAQRLPLVSTDVGTGAYPFGTGPSDDAEQTLRLGPDLSVLKDRVQAAMNTEEAAWGGASRRAGSMSDWPIS